MGAGSALEARRRQNRHLAAQQTHHMAQWLDRDSPLRPVCNLHDSAREFLRPSHSATVSAGVIDHYPRGSMSQ